MAIQPAELTRLMDNARNYTPGALEASLKLELFNVLDEFLQKTKFWQEDISYTTRSGRRSYELVGSELGVVTSLMANVNAGGSRVGATMRVAGTIELAREPSEAQVLTATVSYTVVDPTGSDDYPRFPDGLLQQYGAGILAGLVGRMMSQPAKPYTNERLAIFNTRKFYATVSEARAAVLHKNIYGGQTWRFPRFASGSQR